VLEGGCDIYFFSWGEQHAAHVGSASSGLAVAAACTAVIGVIDAVAGPMQQGPSQTHPTMADRHSGQLGQGHNQQGMSHAAAAAAAYGMGSMAAAADGRAPGAEDLHLQH